MEGSLEVIYEEPAQSRGEKVSSRDAERLSGHRSRKSLETGHGNDEPRSEMSEASGSKEPMMMQRLRGYIAAEHLDKKNAPLDLSTWTDVIHDKLPRQENDFDCGVFVCQYIEVLSRTDGQFNFSQQDMPQLREKMTSQIRQMQL